MRIRHLTLAACLVTVDLWAADDPFVGKWKVNPSKSKLTDEMKVEAVAANKYAITFGPGQVDTIIADGSDQPALQGSTLSLTVEGPDNWKVVRKREGRPIITALWTLSGDGKTLNDDFTAYQPGGSTIKMHYMYERTAGSSGFTGTWDSDSKDQLNSVIELEIQPYQGDGLSFNSSLFRANGWAKNLKFDGHDCPDEGPNAVPGAASSGRRASKLSLELTDKMQGRIAETRQIELSTDLETLTMSILPVGASKPKIILVFERE
jgi:hypothetical protein